ncbi:MAG: hypothetical protein F4X11_11475 [Acidobacteria bacterium]|nr:hypothetical protein [Acidobacteriota bacterium]
MTMSNREPASESECERFADALAALVDESLDPRDRRRVDAHLADCEACRGLLADLRAIRSLAATLKPIEPPARVWHDVRRRVAAEGRASRAAAGWWSRWSFGGAGPIRAAGLWPRWSVGGTALAAAAGIVLATVLVRSLDRVPLPTSDMPGGAELSTAAGGLGPFEPAYVSAIRDLEQLAGSRGPALPAVQTVLAGNLAVVERAITESRSAVEAAPGSAVARDRLRAGLARKLALLRTSAALGLEPGGRGDPRP